MRPLTVAIVATLLLFTGCRGDAELPSTGDAGPLALMATEPAADLRLAMVRPSTFRPDEVALSDQAGVIVADLLYDGLTEVDGTTGALGPGLARSWEADDDLKRWTFALDPTGDVEAEAVVSALGALATGSDGGTGPRRAGAALVADMASVRAVGDWGVAIELERPNAGLPWILSGLAYSVVGIDGVPTGDYEILDDGDDALHLERRTSRGGSLGATPTIEIRWAEHPDDAYRLLVDGVVDGAIVDEVTLADAERRFGVDPAPTSAVRFYVLNPGSAELADRERRATLVGLADPVGLVDEVARADLLVVDGLVPPSMAGYRPDSCGDVCGELDDGTGGIGAPVAPWPTDLPLRVTFAGTGQAATAEALAAQLRGAGMSATAVEATAADLASAIVDGSPDLFAFGWVAPAGSVDAVLPPLLRADSPANVARFESPRIQELVATAARTRDDEARWDLLAEAHRLALVEAKVLPVAASTGTLVMAPGHAGVVIRTDGTLDVETSG